jgi:hypothetical protein
MPVAIVVNLCGFRIFQKYESIHDFARERLEFIRDADLNSLDLEVVADDTGKMLTRFLSIMSDERKKAFYQKENIPHECLDTLAFSRKIIRERIATMHEFFTRTLAPAVILIHELANRGVYSLINLKYGPELVKRVHAHELFTIEIEGYKPNDSPNIISHGLSTWNLQLWRDADMEYPPYVHEMEALKIKIRECPCGEKGKNKCSRCEGIYYCCREHQREHWKEHKQLCVPIGEKK